VAVAASGADSAGEASLLRAAGSSTTCFSTTFLRFFFVLQHAAGRAGQHRRRPRAARELQREREKKEIRATSVYPVSDPSSLRFFFFFILRSSSTGMLLHKAAACAAPPVANRSRSEARRRRRRRPHKHESKRQKGQYDINTQLMLGKRSVRSPLYPQLGGALLLLPLCARRPPVQRQPHEPLHRPRHGCTPPATPSAAPRALLHRAAHRTPASRRSTSSKRSRRTWSARAGSGCARPARALARSLATTSPE
jgi:hypothetical protein